MKENHNYLLFYFLFQEGDKKKVTDILKGQSAEHATIQKFAQEYKIRYKKVK